MISAKVFLSFKSLVTSEVKKQTGIRGRRKKWNEEVKKQEHKKKRVEVSTKK